MTHEMNEAEMTAIHGGTLQPDTPYIPPAPQTPMDGTIKAVDWTGTTALINQLIKATNN